MCFFSAGVIIILKETKIKRQFQFTWILMNLYSEINIALLLSKKVPFVYDIFEEKEITLHQKQKLKAELSIQLKSELCCVW
jgi:hypothetical protein